MGQWTRRGGAHSCLIELTYLLTPEAEAELSDAASFCRQQFGAFAAENFLTTFESKARLIANFPGVGTATLKGRYLFPIRRYPFSMLHRVEENAVRISAIAHHGRRPGYWRKRELIEKSIHGQRPTRDA